MDLEKVYKELINVDSYELYERYNSDDYVDEYRRLCLKIIEERGDLIACEQEEASGEVYYEGCNFITAWKLMFKKCVDFEGRSSRSEFWYAYLAQYIALSLYICVSNAGFSLILGIYIVVSIVPMYALVVRRLHDVGKSGWLWFLNFIPLAGIYLIVLFCKAGTLEKNKYGENPCKRVRKNDNSASEMINLNSSENEHVNSRDKIDAEAIEEQHELSFCRQCGTQLLNDSKFCHKCGCGKAH